MPAEWPYTGLLSWALTTLVSAFVGSYLAGYLKKKGENLATKEDFEALARQTAALTRITQDIEASVSDKIWDRQKQWEMKREAIFAMVEALSQADDRMMELIGVYQLAHQDGLERWNATVSKSQRAWSEQLNHYDEKRFGAELVCGKAMVLAMHVAGLEMRRTEQKMRADQVDDYDNLLIHLQEKIRSVLEVARAELGITS